MFCVATEIDENGVIFDWNLNICNSVALRVCKRETDLSSKHASKDACTTNASQFLNELLENQSDLNPIKFIEFVLLGLCDIFFFSCVFFFFIRFMVEVMGKLTTD